MSFDIKDDFWELHVSLSEAARRIGTSRQNIQQRCLRGSIPSDRDRNGKIGVPIAWIQETLDYRSL